MYSNTQQDVGPKQQVLEPSTDYSVYQSSHLRIGGGPSIGTGVGDAPAAGGLASLIRYLSRSKTSAFLSNRCPTPSLPIRALPLGTYSSHSGCPMQED